MPHAQISIVDGLYLQQAFAMLILMWPASAYPALKAKMSTRPNAAPSSAAGLGQQQTRTTAARWMAASGEGFTSIYAPKIEDRLSSRDKAVGNQDGSPCRAPQRWFALTHSLQQQGA